MGNSYAGEKLVGGLHPEYTTFYTLLLAKEFENFRKMGLKIYHLGIAKFISAPGLA